MPFPESARSCRVRHTPCGGLRPNMAQCRHVLG
jgi:hypothetical protein